MVQKSPQLWDCQISTSNERLNAPFEKATKVLGLLWSDVNLFGPIALADSSSKHLRYQLIWSLFTYLPHGEHLYQFSFQKQIKRRQKTGNLSPFSCAIALVNVGDIKSGADCPSLIVPTHYVSSSRASSWSWSAPGLGILSSAFDLGQKSRWRNIYEAAINNMLWLILLGGSLSSS